MSDNNDNRCPAEDGSAAERVASRGIHTMRHLANFALATGIDVLRGKMGERCSRQILGSIRETRRTIQVGQQIGETKKVIDPESMEESAEERSKRLEAELLAEEAELDARAKALAERKKALGGG